DLRMPGMPDQDDIAPLARVALHFHVNLGHQRAGRIEYGQASFLRLPLDRARYSVRGEDDRALPGHFRELLHEHRPQSAQTLDDVMIVDDLVAHVDRPAEQLDRPLDDVDRPVDACTETTRIGE